MRDASLDVWVPSVGAAIPGSFHNATRSAELEALGLIQPLPERRFTMPAKSAKKTGLASLSKAKLREKLLATQTISDGAWTHLHGNPEREKGENRESFIRRVLA